MDNKAHDIKELSDLEDLLFDAVFRPGILPKHESFRWAVGILKDVLVSSALAKTNGHKQDAADLLGMERSTLTMAIANKRYDIPFKYRRKHCGSRTECGKCGKEYLTSQAESCPACAVDEVISRLLGLRTQVERID